MAPNRNDVTTDLCIFFSFLFISIVNAEHSFAFTSRLRMSMGVCFVLCSSTLYEWHHSDEYARDHHFRWYIWLDRVLGSDARIVFCLYNLSWTLVLSSSDKITMIIMMSTTMLDDSTTQLHTVADGWRCCHYHKRIMHSICVCLSMMKLHIAFRPSAQSTLHSPIRLNILKRWGWDDYMSQRHRTRPWRDSTRMPLAMAVNKYHHHHHLRGDQTPFVSIELHSIFIGMALLAGGNVESRFTAVAKIDSRPSECHYDGTRAQNWNFEIATQKADATF